MQLHRIVYIWGEVLVEQVVTELATRGEEQF